MAVAGGAWHRAFGPMVTIVWNLAAGQAVGKNPATSRKCLCRKPFGILFFSPNLFSPPRQPSLPK